MQYFIFNHQRTLTQKLILCSIAIFLIYFGFPSLEFTCLYIFDPIEGESYYFIDGFGLILILISFIILFFVGSKPGLIVKNGELQTSKFIFGKPFNSKYVNISKTKGIDILKFNYRDDDNEEDDMFDDGRGIGSLGTEATITDYKVYLLNEGHSKRNLICQTYDKEEAKSVTKFLTEGLQIPRVKYNPPAARRRKMRRRR